MKYTKITYGMCLFILTGLTTTNLSAATIKVTRGAYNGTDQAAQDILNQGTCSRITKNKLIALMLSIP